MVARYRFVGVLVLLALAGCQKMRTLEEIEAEKRELPGIYFTEKTNKEIRAPEAKGLHIDPQTKEICYQPFECTNPDCPGRSPDGKGFIFIHRLAEVSVGPDGQIAYEQPPAGMTYAEFAKSKGTHDRAMCPKCLAQRNLQSETDEQRAQYSAWLRPYVLPETAKRRAELEAEYQEAYQALQKKRRGES